MNAELHSKIVDRVSIKIFLIDTVIAMQNICRDGMHFAGIRQCLLNLYAEKNEKKKKNDNPNYKSENAKPINS